MTYLDVTVWRTAPRLKYETMLVTSWLLLALPVLWIVVSIFGLPYAWLGLATYATVAAMCLELLGRAAAYMRARTRLSQR